MGSNRSKNQDCSTTGHADRPGQHCIPGAPGRQGPGSPPGNNGCNGTKGEPGYRSDEGSLGGKCDRSEPVLPGERDGPAAAAEYLNGIMEHPGHNDIDGPPKALLQPKHSKEIRAIDDFWANVILGQHYALKRRDLGITYFHHFVISEVSRSPEFVKVVHYTGTAKMFLKSSSSIFGIIMEEVIERNGTGSSDLLDVEGGLYLVDDPLYRDLDDPQKAIERARQRVGECDYDPLFNNCEHFASWTLTGVPSSHQADLARPSHKLVGALLSELKSLIYRFGSSAVRSLYQGLIVGLEALACIGRCNCLPRLLQHTSGATRGAKAAMAGCAFALSLLIEALFLAWILHKKHRLYKEGKMTKEDFQSAVVNELLASVASIIASTIGAVIGQCYIPVPLVGGLVGGFFGYILARPFASCFCVLIKMVYFRFSKWFSALSEKIACMVTRR